MTALSLWSWTLANIGPWEVIFSPPFNLSYITAYTATVPFIMNTVSLKATFNYTGSVISSLNLGNGTAMPISQYSVRYPLAVGPFGTNTLWMQSTRDGPMLTMQRWPETELPRHASNLILALIVLPLC
jgi:hypothetical protein